MAWKIVALVVSGRKSTDKILRNMVHRLKPIVPEIRIDFEPIGLNSAEGELDLAFDNALKADLVVGIIDEAFGGIVTNPRAVTQDFLHRASNLISFMGGRNTVPGALFIRLRPEAPSSAFRQGVMGLLGSNNDISTIVNTNNEFESSLYKFFWEHLTPLRDLSTSTIPSQGAGPHFGLSIAGRIASAPMTSIDQNGNDLRRVGQLLPLIRECADEFLVNSGSLGNQHPSLVRDVNRYRQLISSDVETIEWGTLWGIGVKLETSTAAAERRVADRLAPELEDELLTALQSLRNLHAPLILATAEGRELQEQADRMRMTRGEQAKLHDAAVALSEGLIQHEKVIEPEAAFVVAEAAETVGTEPHPERGTAYGIASLKNITIVLFGAALAIAPKYILGNHLGEAGTMGAWEALKKWPAFAKAAEALGKDIQTLAAEERAVVQVAVEQLMPFRAFIVAHEQNLRVIAGTTPQLRWLLPYVDYIVRTS